MTKRFFKAVPVNAPKRAIGTRGAPPGIDMRERKKEPMIPELTGIMGSFYMAGRRPCLAFMLCSKLSALCRAMSDQ